MTIRRAQLGDTARLVAMGQRFVAETGYLHFTAFDAAQVARMVAVLLEVGTIFVAERDGVVVGFLAAAIAQAHPFSGQCTASEAAWWVEPEHRAGMLGVRLMDAFESWAIEQGAVRLEMIAPVGSNHVGAFYERRGYSAVEVTYQRRVL